ncbi:MAG: hypothetical protein JWR24_4398 [Actinoallomurus sp.]|nr:hypothetical protein [Actinoallomurus sp.]
MSFRKLPFNHRKHEYTEPRRRDQDDHSRRGGWRRYQR